MAKKSSKHVSRSMIRNFSPDTSPHMSPTVIINIAGLSFDLLKQIPSLAAFADSHQLRRIQPMFPALTCSTQSTYLTGLMPQQHGIVGNGWYARDLGQVFMWPQSNRLVGGEKLWETAKIKNPSFTCANLFWWFNRYSSVDYFVTPLPQYRATGLKLPDIDSEPLELRQTLQKELGQFPLFQFWGPGANIRSTQWIARASQRVFETFRPTLSLVYLPHLDYCLQREGPQGIHVPKELKALDLVCAELIQFFRSHQVQIIFISEYGISPVTKPIAINRILRQKGWLALREESGKEYLDPGRSPAFAVADHQLAHVYIQKPDLLPHVRQALETVPGIEKILSHQDKINIGINHERSGDLVLTAKQDHWFSYPFWLDDRKAPDFARTVEIHKKTGYDPNELFIDPTIFSPQLKVMSLLLSKKLGFRTVMNLIPLNDQLVMGSHGSSQVPEIYWPVFMSDHENLEALVPSKPTVALRAQDLKAVFMSHIFPSNRPIEWSK